MWSTLAGWLQHMPALSRLLLKLGPKIIKFVLLQSLFQGACSQRVSKNLNIK
jgi:hypothetical protein